MVGPINLIGIVFDSILMDAQTLTHAHAHNNKSIGILGNRIFFPFAQNDDNGNEIDDLVKVCECLCVASGLSFLECLA